MWPFSYVPFSDTLPWPGALPQTTTAVVIVCSVGLMAARGRIDHAVSLLTVWYVPVGVWLAVALLWDAMALKRYRVHTRGAILVTGASTGIGRAAAVALAECGYTVWAGVRNEPDAESIRAQGTALGVTSTGSLQPVLIDVTQSDTIARAVETIAESGVPLVGLVNNAGAAATMLPIELAGSDLWRRTFDINVFGLLETTQACLPMLRASKGRVINVGSLVGSVGTIVGNGPYSASKFAVEGMSDTMRAEYGAFGISVSLIKPGAIRTKLFGKLTTTPTNDSTTTTATGTPPNEAGSDDGIKALVDRELAKGRGSREDKELYRPQVTNSMTITRTLNRSSFPADPRITTAAIVHAITSEYPRTRYLVGIDAILLHGLRRLLPDRVLDRLLTLKNPMEKHRY